MAGLPGYMTQKEIRSNYGNRRAEALTTDCGLRRDALLRVQDMRKHVPPELLQAVGFYQRDTGCPVLPAHDCGVVARRQRENDGRFAAVLRLKQGRFHCCRRVILPIVLERNQTAITIAYFKCRIL